MEQNEQQNEGKRGEQKKGISLFRVFFIILFTMVFTAVGTFFLIKYTLFGGSIEPVHLTRVEETQLDAKLEHLGEGIGRQESRESDKVAAESEEDFDAAGNLKPEVYSEEGSSRTIEFTEREINALIDKNTDLAKKVAVDLAENMISMRMRFPMDEDLPVIGGKLLKVRAGVEVLCDEEKCPVVILRGVSLMGVPVPNAWIGGIKNVDLVKRFGGGRGTRRGFWQSFEDGVEKIYVREGKLHLELKE